MVAINWEEFEEREQDFVLDKLESVRRDCIARVRRADTHGNDFEQCKAELSAVEAAIAKLEAA